MRKNLYSAVVWGLAVAISGDAESADEKPAVAEEAPQSKSKLWSYQPVRTPAVPAVKQQDWVRTPIDAFILAKQEEKGLTPSADADRAAFIRRATLDVWGVIPTPQEVDAFVNDDSDKAYEKLVERLLASPKYGERQGRKWLDLARYADSTGFQNDNDRLNMWRYRDYVINAFNQDKPYSRFLQEQLAGDELWPDREEALIATGFMAQFPDNANSRDLVQRKYQITTDITDTVGKVVLGQSDATKELYGLNNEATKAYGELLLRARRLTERGVRFIQVVSGPTDIKGDSRDWDAHQNIEENHSTHARIVDKPIAGLLKDLKAKGLLESTLVVWTSEFGRTSWSESGDGRDHNPWGYTQWIAGGGINAGTTYGSTDEIGLQAEKGKEVDTYDLHATVLNQLGLDHLKLIYKYQGRSERPTVVYGKVIKDLIT